MLLTTTAKPCGQHSVYSKADCDVWLREYNTERPYLGYRNMGRCPIETVTQFSSKLSD
jgi:hypothetical protein